MTPLAGTRLYGPLGQPSGRRKILSAYSVQFDGVNDYISIPHHSSLATPGSFSVAFWAKALSLMPNFDGFLGKTNSNSWTQGWGFYSTGSGIRFFAGHFGNHGIEASVSDLAAWHHYAGTWDGTTKRLYIDGSLAVSGSGAGTYDATDSILIGALGYVDYCANVRIDDFRIYNVAIGLSDVADLYAGVPIGSPVGYWAMDDGSDITATDSSGSGNHGTLTNGPIWSTDVPSNLQ